MPLERTVLDTHPLTYLLWGEGVGPNHGLGARWGRLAAARIGILDVPVEGIGTLWRVKLHALEYLAEYAHGNVAVAEERLMKLEVERG
jgi:CRISPR-associated protein (TIGR03984 family)